MNKYQCAAVVSLLALTGCPGSPVGNYIQHQKNERLAEEAKAQFKISKKACHDQYAAGNKTNHSQLATCINSALIEESQHMNYPYMDLIYAANAKRSEIAEREDAKKISVAQGAVEFAEYAKIQTEEERRRNIENADHAAGRAALYGTIPPSTCVSNKVGNGAMVNCF